MGYKINIRNASNTDWVNLLQDQFVVHDYTTTGIGTSATDNVELALKELFENKIERVVSTTAPTASDDDHQIGAIWVDTTTDTAYICLDNTSGAAIWHSSGMTQEEVEDIVGAMVDGNTENGISVTYDDAAGKINFDVNDPVLTIAGDVNGSATMTDLGDTTINVTISGGYYNQQESDDRFVNVVGDTMTGPLAINSSLTVSAGHTVDEFSTDGTLSGNSDTALPTEQAVKTYVDSKVSGLDWRAAVISASADTPPSSPATGDRYLLLPTTLNGDWSGHTDDIAEWDGSAWVFHSPENGWTTHVQDEARYYTYNGNTSSWVPLGAEVQHNALNGLQGGLGTDEFFHLSNAEHDAITGSKTQNTVFAAPDGASGVGSFRALVANDIPTLDSTKISDFEEAAQDAYGALVAAGTQENITVTYDDTNNKVDFSVNIGVAASASDIANAGVVSFDDSQFTVDANGFVQFVTNSTIDHGDLLGLADDDHTQYVHISNARTIDAVHTFNPGTADTAPFILGTNAQGAWVEGLNADMVDGHHWNVSSTSNEPTTTQVNDIWIEVTA
jgi:hypothetical protein